MLGAPAMNGGMSDYVFLSIEMVSVSGCVDEMRRGIKKTWEKRPRLFGRQCLQPNPGRCFFFKFTPVDARKVECQEILGIKARKRLSKSWGISEGQ